jgi:hypothetical protein
MLVLFAAPARPEVDLTKWTEAYLEAAFPTGSDRLRKYMSANEIDYGIDCLWKDNKNCNDGRVYLETAIVRNRNMQVYERKAGRLRFVFASKSNLTHFGADISKLFAGGIIDAQDADCQLYMSLHDDRIVVAVVVVSLDASPEKITTCMLVNFNRALGLSLPGDAPFSAKWAQRSNFTIIRPLGPNPETAPASGEFKMSPAFKQSQHAAKIFAHIHSCRELVAGMTKSEVIAQLGKGSVCLSDLKGG